VRPIIVEHDPVDFIFSWPLFYRRTKTKTADYRGQPKAGTGGKMLSVLLFIFFSTSPLKGPLSLS